MYMIYIKEIFIPEQGISSFKLGWSAFSYPLIGFANACDASIVCDIQPKLQHTYIFMLVKK